MGKLRPLNVAYNNLLECWQLVFMFFRCNVQLYHPLDVFVYHIPWIVKIKAILWHKGSFHYIMKCLRFNKTFSFILFLTFVFIFSFKTTSLLGFWWHHNILLSKQHILMCKTNLSPMSPRHHEFTIFYKYLNGV